MKTDGKNRKILVVIDHLTPDMFSGDSSNPTFNFQSSEVGKLFYKTVSNSRSGYGLDKDSKNIDLTFYYSQIPNVDAKGNFKLPSKTSKKVWSKCNDDLDDYILKTKPSLVIIYGKLISENYIDKKDATKLEFVKKTIEKDGKEFSVYISINPSFTVVKNASNFRTSDRFVIENRFIRRYIQGGIENTKPQLGKYEYITTMDRVHTLFNMDLPNQEIVAADFETNTLETWQKGAKAIMFSCSWREHQGVAIPLTSKYFSDADLGKIMDYILELFRSDQKKVMHNGQFDLRMLMDIYGLDYAKNVIDTLMMYYVGYADAEASRDLKHLAYKYTDMGGYEDPRDDYFSAYLEAKKQEWIKKEEKRLLEESVATGKKPRSIKISEYKPPINEIDGGKINFEWLPSDIIYSYASADTDVCLQLYHIFKKHIDKNPQWKHLVYEWYPSLGETLSYIEHTGMSFDREKALEYKEGLIKLRDSLLAEMYKTVPEITEYENNNIQLLAKRKQLMDSTKTADRTKEDNEFIKEVGKLAGTDKKTGLPSYKFFPSSNQKVGKLLYVILGYDLPPQKEFLVKKSQHKVRTPEKIVWKDYSVGVEALDYLRDTYDSTFAKLLSWYAKVDKLLGSFVESFLDLADYNNLIHPHFLAHGTATSRLSSQNPKQALGL